MCIQDGHWSHTWSARTLATTMSHFGRWVRRRQFQGV
jgi:hypothetical protein